MVDLVGEEVDEVAEVAAVVAFVVEAAVLDGGSASLGGEAGEQAGAGKRAGERPPGYPLDPAESGVSILAASRSGFRGGRRGCSWRRSSIMGPISAT